MEELIEASILEFAGRQNDKQTRDLILRHIWLSLEVTGGCNYEVVVHEGSPEDHTITVTIYEDRGQGPVKHRYTGDF